MYKYYKVIWFKDEYWMRVEYTSYLKSKAQAEVNGFNEDAPKGERMALLETLTHFDPDLEDYTEEERKLIKKVCCFNIHRLGCEGHYKLQGGIDWDSEI